MKKLPQRRWMSLWRHFLEREKTADQLSSSMREWQQRWNWDFMKVNPSACYHVLDWGAEYRFYEDGVTEPKLLQPVIREEADMNRIGSVDVTQGALGEQLRVIRNLRNHFGPELPMVETIFSPIEIAHRLMNGRKVLQQLLRKSPDAFHRLLDQISRVFSDFALECIGAGADGVFLATKWASSDLLEWSEYEQFGKRYELPLLQALQQNDALVILHVCGARTYLREMIDYPCDIFSYDFFAEGAPDPEEIILRSGRFVLGGIDPDRLQKDPSGVIRECARFAHLSKWLAGPSCVIFPGTAETAIQEVKDGLWSLP